MDKIDLFSKIVLRILYIREEGTSMGWEYGKIESLHFLINWNAICNNRTNRFDPEPKEQPLQELLINVGHRREKVSRGSLTQLARDIKLLRLPNIAAVLRAMSEARNGAGSRD